MNEHSRRSHPGMTSVRPLDSENTSSDVAVAPIEPDRVMRARVNDTAHALPTRRLEHVPGADHVGRQDLVPRVLARDRAEVDDAIDAAHGGFHRGEIGEVGGRDLFALAR